RNFQRPLFFGISAKRSVIYYASEDWFIRGCVQRAGEKLVDDDIYYLLPNHLYEFNPRKAPWSVEDIVKKDMMGSKPKVKVKQQIPALPKYTKAPLKIEAKEEQKILPFVRNKVEKTDG